MVPGGFFTFSFFSFEYSLIGIDTDTDIDTDADVQPYCYDATAKDLTPYSIRSFVVVQVHR